jgi:hypothetical protein
MSHCICGVATAVRGSGDEIGETNVSVGQFNQSSIEILFAVCHGLGRRRAELFKALGCLFGKRFSPKETAQSFKITRTSSMNVSGRTQIDEDQCK